jgi:hypothetical protein
MRLRKRYFLFVLLFAFSGAGKLAAQEVDYKAYSLFVYNFMKYIEWPEGNGEFVVGILGDSPIIKELQNLAKTKKPRGRTLVVKKITTLDEAANCQLVYVSDAKSSMLKQLVEKVKGKPVLVVGEREGMARKGAALSFMTDEDDTLKFEINKAALEKNGLKIPAVLSNLGILI